MESLTQIRLDPDNKSLLEIIRKGVESKGFTISPTKAANAAIRLGLPQLFKNMSVPEPQTKTTNKKGTK